jgi:hypothetical protein
LYTAPLFHASSIPWNLRRWERKAASNRLCYCSKTDIVFLCLINCSQLLSLFLSFFSRREGEPMAGRCNENKGCVNSKLTLLTTGTRAFLHSGFSRRPARIGCRCCCSGKRCYQLLPAEASVLLTAVLQFRLIFFSLFSKNCLKVFFFFRQRKAVLPQANFVNLKLIRC